MAKAKKELRPENERFENLLKKLTEFTEELNKLSGDAVRKAFYEKVNRVSGGKYVTEEFYKDDYTLYYADSDEGTFTGKLPGNFPEGMKYVKDPIARRVELETKCKTILNEWNSLKSDFENYKPLDMIDEGHDETRLQRINKVLDTKKRGNQFSPREIITQAFDYVSVVMVKERLLWFFDDLWSRVEKNIKNLKLDKETMLYSHADNLRKTIMQARSDFIASADLDSGLDALRMTCSYAYDELTQKDFEEHRGYHNREDHPYFNSVVDFFRGCLGVINFILNVPGVLIDVSVGELLGFSTGTLKYMKEDYVSTFFKTPKTRTAKSVETFEKGILKDSRLEQEEKDKLDPTKNPLSGG